MPYPPRLLFRVCKKTQPASAPRAGFEIRHLTWGLAATLEANFNTYLVLFKEVDITRQVLREFEFLFGIRSIPALSKCGAQPALGANSTGALNESQSIQIPNRT